jgi:hypothetical protein
MRQIADAMSSTDATTNPVFLSLTISGKAPLRHAITGVPAAIASIASNELVSLT